MREGPLAALFRSTTDDAADTAPAQPAAKTDEAAPTPAEAPVAPATVAGGASVSEPEAPREVDPLLTDGPKAPPPHPRESGVPHPSLATTDRPWESADIYPSRPQVKAEPSPWSPQTRSLGQPVIRVVGVGGAGVNAVNRMVEAGVSGVEFLAINTDLQSLQQSTADITLHIGPQLTRGLGAGSDPELGRQAAMEEFDRIKSLLRGSDMVFIAAGEGGGTGTGAGPVVARIAREVGALTVGIVTKPFGFEGNRRASAADAGIDALATEVDTLIIVPNNRLLSVLDKRTSMVDAFKVADDVLRQGVQGISDLVTLPGIINLDFADVRTIMSDAGAALLGIGMGTGEQRAVEAAERAVSSPLLETSMAGARSILLSITGGSDLSLWEVNEAAKAVAEAAHPDANIIFGAMVDEKLDDNQVWITVVATRYDGAPSKRRPLDVPAGEPRVTRRSEPRERAGAVSGRSSSSDVPEFLRG
jgi:cell division protein FtsZ